VPLCFRALRAIGRERAQARNLRRVDADLITDHRAARMILSVDRAPRENEGARAHGGGSGGPSPLPVHRMDRMHPQFLFRESRRKNVPRRRKCRLGSSSLPRIVNSRGSNRVSTSFNITVGAAIKDNGAP